MIRRLCYVMFTLAVCLAPVLAAGPVLASPGQTASPVPAAYQDDDDDIDDDFDDDFDDDTDNDDFVQPPAPGVQPDDEDDVDEDDFDDDDGFDDDDVAVSGGNDPLFQPPLIDEDDDQTTDGFRSQQVVVQLAPGADLTAFMGRHGAVLAAAIPDQRLYLIGLPGTATEEAALNDLLADDDTVWAELNYAHQAPEGRPGRFFLSAEVVAPDQVAAAEPPAALGIGSALACATGAGMIVAVLDTGVDATHPALANQIAGGGWNVLTNSPDTRDVGNGVDDDGDGLIDEMTGHGTHVAGIIAQVAPQAGIMPIKVLDSDGVGDAFYVAAGIYQAIGSGADVINLSLGSTRDARVIADAVAAAHDAGIVVVAAAGNADRELPPEYPAVDPNAFGIAATDATDDKSEFSNYHERLLLSAPGTDIVSAFPGGGYVSWSGTSMAAPWVAGAAAVVRQQAPNLTVAELSERLADAADPIPDHDPRYDGLLGAGRLDVGAAAGCSTG